MGKGKEEETAVKLPGEWSEFGQAPPRVPHVAYPEREVPRVYLASGFENREQVRFIADALRWNHGIELTFRWMDVSVLGPERRALGVESDDLPRPEVSVSGLSVIEVEAVRCADLLVVLLPGQRGTHVELGVALALGVPVLMFGCQECFHPAMYEEPPFWRHPGVKRATLTSGESLVKGTDRHAFVFQLDEAAVAAEIAAEVWRRRAMSARM